MQPPPVREYTIRHRIIFLYCLVFVFIGLLITAYTWQIFSLEKRLTALENFHDLFDNVLEVRRYEKNLLFQVGTDNLDNLLFYLDKVEKDLVLLADDIEQVLGNENFFNFRLTFENYKTTFKNYQPGRRLNATKIRQQGKILIDFTSELLTLKQGRIKWVLKRILYSFIVVTGSFFLFILLALHLQSKSVLDRIAFVRRATRDLLQGNFTPIEDNALKKDEVSDLILAFNKMANEIETKQEQLVQSRKLAAIGTFSSGIAHELNNPLNNISLSADTLIEDFDDLDKEEFKEIIHDIILQTERASGVVKNLLDFSRDKAPSATRLNIKQVISATARLIANQLRLSSVQLENYIPDDLPPVMGDMQKLQQVFLNLFVNAIQVMPDGGLIHIDAREEPEGYIQVRVSDTGSGIPPEKLEHIFDPFYTTKAVGQGTGLGLSIVYGIIKKHGGYVEVKSKLNVGTTFSIFLPVTAPEEQE